MSVVWNNPMDGDRGLGFGVESRRPQAPCLRRKRWSDRALRSLPRNGHKYELFNGRIVMSPAGFNHGRICGKILRLLGNYAEAHHLGIVCDGQTGFRLTVGCKKKTVLSPDVSFVDRSRAASATTSLDRFFEGAPDLVVEVLSLGDSVEKTSAKLAHFFRNGAQLGWIIDPSARQVHVLRPDELAALLKSGDTLTGGPVLSGFRLSVRRLFED